MNKQAYWEKIAEIDKKISDLRNKLFEASSDNKLYNEIMNDLYDLRQEKKRVQREQGKSLKSSRNIYS